MPTDPVVFSFNGRLAVTLQVLGHDFELVGTTDLNDSPTMSLEFLPPPGQATVDLGTIGQILAAMRAANWKLSDTAGTGPMSADTLFQNLKAAATNLPGFKQVLTNSFLDTAVASITEIRLDLTAPAAANDELPPGVLTLGLGLDLSSTTELRPFGIQLRAIALHVKFHIG